MDQTSFTGGSRIGWVNASYPFAKLSCSREKISLSSLGRYDFGPEQVVSFGTYGSIPFFANGLRIHHNRLDYPEKVVFWCMGSRDKVLVSIGQTGFIPSGKPVARMPGFALRWSAVVAYLLIWNLLFLMDGRTVFEAHAALRPGLGAMAALALTFALSTGIKVSRRLRTFVLAPGHVLGEVKGMFSLLQLVSGTLCVIFGLTYLFARI